MKGMLTRLKICMGAKEARIGKTILNAHSDEELEEFFQELETLELGKRIVTLYDECKEKIIKDIGFCQILQWLLMEGIALNRIEAFLLKCKETYPSADSYAAMREVLQDKEVPDDCLYDYWKYYRDEVTETEEKQRLWKGLRFYRNKTGRQEIELLTEKERRVLLQPAFSSVLFYGLKDMGAIFRAFEKEGFAALVQMLMEIAGTNYDLEPEAFQQIACEPERIREQLQQVLHIIPTEQRSAFAFQWLESENLLQDLYKMAYRLPEMESSEMEILWQSRVAYIGLLYKTPNGIPFEGLSICAEELLIYAIIHKKRHFLKIAEKCGENFRRLTYHSMLSDRDFYQKFVNLNTLNEKELLDSMEYARLEAEQKEYMKNPEYTFEEIRCFYGQEAEYVQFYHFLTHTRVDARLCAFREIIKKQCLPKNLDTEQMERLGEKLTEKKLSVWMKKDFLHIQGLRPETAIQILLYQEKIERFIPDIKSELQVKYILKSQEYLAPFANMEEFNQSLLETDKTWRQMKEDFALTEEFVEENRNRILQFLHNGGAEIMTAFYSCSEGAKEKARRLVTAELMGRFIELKYYKDDLSKEISFALTNRQKAVWMEREEANEADGICVWEEDGLLPVMQIGEIPKYTCMSYLNGGQRKCLLSCFDANKKVIFVSQYGHIIFRAIVRLTKGCYLCEKNSKESQQEVEFIDILAEEKRDMQPEDPLRKEKLVLFLERPYYKGMSPEELKSVMSQVIHLVERKAEKLGAKLVLNREYSNLAEQMGFIRSTFYLYISKSKNGSQYLDSLGGSASVSDAGNYRSGIFFLKEQYSLEDENAA